ncbi:MAG: RdgB/HAM1 family non-canonical purine NTP pyrophosphatase [Synergistaceae bacterium]|nr:RdgB/HAM1 family non-canonical purine NTP pyrophosphatase [Synergistaceae bacterium]
MLKIERLVLATGNRGKYEEFSAMLPRSLAAELVFAPELGRLTVEETGETYADNARLKARAWAQASGLPCLADDSGLEAEALDGAPGVRSARIVPGSDEDRNNWLLEQLRGKSNRRGRFVAALALVVPLEWELICRGECPGRIAESPAGLGGFGYDPLFVPDGFDASFAELPPATKNVISHRAVALRRMLDLLGQ